jgi:hypothetical protein
MKLPQVIVINIIRISTKLKTMSNQIKRQSTLKEFFLSDQSSDSEPSEEENILDQSIEVIGPKKRGPPEEPLKWTRVIKVTRCFSNDIPIFELDKD